MTLFDGVYIHPESYGTVLVIGAWNFPLLLTLAPVLPAIAAGNNNMPLDVTIRCHLMSQDFTSNIQVTQSS